MNKTQAIYVESNLALLVDSMVNGRPVKAVGVVFSDFLDLRNTNVVCSVVNEIGVDDDSGMKYKVKFMDNSVLFMDLSKCIIVHPAIYTV
jgi:hypothetical protein